MSAYFRILAAGPSFFFSAWVLMLITGAIHGDVGVKPFGYVTSMIVTIALWLAVAPVIGSIARSAGKRAGKKAKVTASV